ncbi:MAG: helix-turn-helix domain-containing protein [Opitutales bacterium]|nr:helix-turn-helix domain-containing protein [Opitutales bacterium]MCH8540578.1 helix-turn-helix domain-containing protein [Opitutales bacterium]
MHSIGEQLEEARKQKGISIRDAAESTKIRGEYLEAFEGNNFDIDLPQIYIRGFLRNYARFLKLDPQAITQEYEQVLQKPAYEAEPREILGAVKKQNEQFLKKPLPSSSSRQRTSLGQIPDPEAEPAESIDPEERAEFNFNREEEHEPSHGFRQTAAEDESDYLPFDKTLYLKIGVILGGAVILIILMVALVTALRSPTTEVVDENDNAEEEVITSTEFMLEATGDILSVTVRDLNTGEELFRGSLSEGMQVPLRREGRVRIATTDGQHLRIEEDGERLRFPSTGRGATVFPQ